MAQGHGLSVMVRAAQVTGQTRFWEAAHLALGPFKKDTTEGGVRNRFLNKYVWYEEYPFTEGLYVLNGFMYSLIGLYDLLSAEGAPPNIKLEAKELFDQGLESLKVCKMNYYHQKTKMTLSYRVSICNKLRFTLKRDLCQPNLIRSINVRMIYDSINHLLHLIACSLFIQIFRLCCHYTTMGKVQTTIFNILSNQKHQIELDGTIILFIFSS